MRTWIFYMLTEKLIALLPFGKRIHYLFHRYITHELHPHSDYFFNALEHAGRHLACYRQFNPGSPPAACADIGTGYHPVMALCAFLCGAEQVISIDTHRLLTRTLLKETMQRVADLQSKGQLQTYIPVRPERFHRMSTLLKTSGDMSMTILLQHLNITYLVQEPDQLPLPDHSTDLVCSSEKFQHIGEAQLVRVLAECRRIVHEGGVISHAIRLDDRLARHSRTISAYHFMRYSDRQWKWMSSPLASINRLRLDDYRQLYTDACIPVSSEVLRKGNPLELYKLKLDARFAKKSLSVNAVTHCHFISHMAKAQPD